MLEIERATLSAVISALVRKGLIDQVPDADDQRQKVLKITTTGTNLWSTLPDPIELIATVAFDGVDDNDIATTNRILREATQRLIDYKKKASKS
jgi:DNA-binding MarR family transcriptional regulator